MDNLVSDAYLQAMFARTFTMLAILAIAVVTTMTTTHAARMSAGSDHAVHVAEMTQAPHGYEVSCDGDRHCGSVDAEMCEFVCAGLSVFLPSPDGDTGQGGTPVSHELPSEHAHVSRTPGLNERPPKPLSPLIASGP